MTISKNLYKIPLDNQSLVGLNKVAASINKGDFAINWWDSSWPLWYYTGLKTVIDGGKYNKDSSIVSQIFTSNNQEQSSKLARYLVETYKAKVFGHEFDTASDFIFSKYKPETLFSLVASYSFELPKKSTDIYFVLSKDMIYKLLTIYRMSQIKNSADEKDKSAVYAAFEIEKGDNKTIFANGMLGEMLVLDVKNGILTVDRLQRKLDVFFDINTQKKQIGVFEYGKNKNFALIRYDDSLIYLDSTLFNSFFVQAFLFENINPAFFEPIYSSVSLKIFRLKI